MIVRMTDPVAPIRRRKPSWAKGLTAADHPGIARQAAARRGKKRGPYRSYGLWQKDPSRVDPHTLLKPTQFTDYAYLFGLYLGDGSITRVNRLEIALDSRQPEIIESCLAAMQSIHPRHRAAVRWKKDSNCKVVSAYAWQWLVLFPQHGPGKKHLRSIRLADWQYEIFKERHVQLLRGLVESDGSRFARWVNGANYPAYSFSNESADIRAIFCWAADLTQVHYTRSSPNTLSIARRADVQRLDSLWPLKRPARS